MISFVVIGKNEGWRLEKCLTAIRRMASSELKQPYEIIYVDSQSTDGSLELAKRYADKSFLITGVCNAAIGRNVGAQGASGDIFFFIDGDMELREGTLLSVFGENKLEYPLVAGVENDILYDNDWKPREERARFPFKYGAEWDDSRPSTGMFVVEKKLWEKVGGMDNRYKKSQDYEFGFRSCAAGYKTHRVGRLWVNHHTRYYDIRKDSLSLFKYPALLSREYFFNRFAFKTLFMWNYSGYLLAFSLLLFLLTFNIFIFVPYVALITYRTNRAYRRNGVRVGWLTILCRRCARDILLLYFFCTFYPKQPVVSYTRIK